MSRLSNAPLQGSPMTLKSASPTATTTLTQRSVPSGTSRETMTIAIGTSMTSEAATHAQADTAWPPMVPGSTCPAKIRMTSPSR